jgi:hypothetical protein
MEIEIFNQTKKIMNVPLIDTKMVENKHLIFIKYTSDIYYKYSIELLETLCQKSKYENKKLLFHTSLNFLLKVLYNSGNVAYLNNYDLLILCCFSLGIKSIENQHKSPSLNRLKRIYPEKYSYYENEDIKIGEIISVKLLNYNINILTSYECLFYLLSKNKAYMHLLDSCIQELDHAIFQGAQYIFKRPVDLAKESIEKVKFKEKQKKGLSEKKQYNNSKGHFNDKNKNNYRIVLKSNNESISTNASSAANISNNANNSDKNFYYSGKSKSIIKNKLKEINTFQGKTFNDFNNEKSENKKTKSNLLYTKNNINYSISPSKRYINTSNNDEHSRKKNKYLDYHKIILRNKNSDSAVYLETIIDNDNETKKVKKIESYENYSSSNIFKKSKIYKKNIKLQFGGVPFKNRIKSPPNEEKQKNLIDYKIRNNIINNKIIHGGINKNVNFNYDKLNELCHKMNFDIFNNE